VLVVESCPCCILHRVALHCTTFNCIAVALHCATITYVKSDCVALRCIALHEIALRCTALYSVVVLYCDTLFCVGTVLQLNGINRHSQYLYARKNPRMRSDLPSSTSTRSFSTSARYIISTFHIKLRYRRRFNIP
jgi:hypothetical protein